MLCAFSIMSALHYRDRTGKGQRIDLALLDSLLIALDNLGERYTIGGELLTRAGNVSFGGSSWVSIRRRTDMWPSPPARAMRCGSGSARSSAATTSYAIPGFATAPARRDRRDQVAGIIQGWTSERTRAEVVDDAGGKAAFPPRR